MDPQTVNAVNLPLQNALSFPAAILQPPFFDPLAPAAVNYGAIGSVIGHEISHTFDTEGSAFDSKGRVRDWWTPSDLAHFKAATARLAAQYDTYRPFPDLSVNGRADARPKTSPITLASRQPTMVTEPPSLASPPPRRTGSPATSSSSSPSGRTGDRSQREASAPPASDDRSALPWRIPRRHGPQRRCVVPGIQCPTRTAAISCSAGSGADLVGN